MMQNILKILKNRYVITIVCFALWMGFMDKDDLISQISMKKQISQLQKEKEYYQQQTAQVKKDLADLSTDKNKLEKFAREKYLMKKDNEDVYVIVREKKQISKKDSLINKVRSIF